MTSVPQSCPYIACRCLLVVLVTVSGSTSTLQAEDREVGAAKGSIDFLPPESADVPRAIVGRFVPGGRNVEAHRYVVSEGYPPIPDRPKFVGMLTGTWLDMGKALGERAGDRVRCTSNIWWTKICDKKGREGTLQAMKLYERQISALDQNQIDFLKGVTEGVSLARSIRLRRERPSTAFRKLLSRLGGQHLGLLAFGAALSFRRPAATALPLLGKQLVTGEPLQPSPSTHRMMASATFSLTSLTRPLGTWFGRLPPRRM